MNDFLQMNIFFFVTTLAVIVVGSFLGIGAYYLMKILKRAEALSQAVQEESKHIAEDIAEIRETVRDKANVDTAARFVSAVFRGKGKSSTRKGRTTKQ